MIAFMAIILLSIAVLGQNDSKTAQELLKQQDSGDEIPIHLHPVPIPFPQGLPEIILNEFKRDEEIIHAPLLNDSKTSNIMINSTTRYSLPNHSNPWIVAINDHGEHSCTGSILNKEWVITASHCFPEPEPDPRNVSVLTGTSFKKDGNEYKVSKIFRHPRYDSCNHKNADIALLKVDGIIHLNDTIKAIELPSTPFEESVEGHQIMTTGWGKDTKDNGEHEHYLGEIWLTTIKSKLCASAYRRLGKTGHIMFRSQFCTWNLHQNVCRGNSGGPAVLYKEGNPILVGTVSYGVRCLDKYPVVFSELSFFLNWINQTMANN